MRSSQVNAEAGDRRPDVGFASQSLYIALKLLGIRELHSMRAIRTITDAA